jgi:predicted nucleic acid-binding protein
VAKPLLVDTDVMIDYLRGHRSAVAYVRRHAEHIVLSSIVVAELYSGVKGDRERAVLDDLVSVFRVAPVTAGIAKAAGLLRCEYGNSHGVGLADAILAATAQAEGAELKTLNAKHYPMFKGLKRAYAKR